MSRIRLVSAAILVLGVGALVAAPGTVRADDVRNEVRLLAAEGRFDAAKQALGKADESVRTDVSLLRQLVDASYGFAKRKAARRVFSEEWQMSPLKPSVKDTEAFPPEVTSYEDATSRAQSILDAMRVHNILAILGGRPEPKGKKS